MAGCLAGTTAPCPFLLLDADPHRSKMRCTVYGLGSSLLSNGELVTRRLLPKITCKILRDGAFYSCKAEGPRAKKPSKIDKGKAEESEADLSQGTRVLLPEALRGEQGRQSRGKA
jgi:hypothetical protein